MKNFKRFLKYLLPYKKFQFLSILFNVLYALFSSLSMLSLFPMMKVLFQDNAKKYSKPVLESITDINMRYLEEYLNFYITTNTEDMEH